MRFACIQTVICLLCNRFREFVSFMCERVCVLLSMKLRCLINCCLSHETEMSVYMFARLLGEVRFDHQDCISKEIKEKQPFPPQFKVNFFLFRSNVM